MAEAIAESTLSGLSPHQLSAWSRRPASSRSSPARNWSASSCPANSSTMWCTKGNSLAGRGPATARRTAREVLVASRPRRTRTASGGSWPMSAAVPTTNPTTAETAWNGWRGVRSSRRTCWPMLLVEPEGVGLHPGVAHEVGAEPGAVDDRVEQGDRDRRAQVARSGRRLVPTDPDGGRRARRRARGRRRGRAARPCWRRTSRCWRRRRRAGRPGRGRSGRLTGLVEQGDRLGEHRLQRVRGPSTRWASPAARLAVSLGASCRAGVGSCARAAMASHGPLTSPVEACHPIEHCSIVSNSVR